MSKCSACGIFQFFYKYADVCSSATYVANLRPGLVGK